MPDPLPTLYGLAALYTTSGTPPPVEVIAQGCQTCQLVCVFVGTRETRRFKRTRAGISVVPYCPTCYTYPPEA